MVTPTAASGPETEVVNAYQRDGFYLAHGLLPESVLQELTEAVPRLLAQEGPRRILERDGVTVRSVYGPHQTNETIARFCHRSELVERAAALVGERVYIHQSKVNVKAAFVGDQWQWHQDYIYWLQDDGIRRPDLVNVAVFLDEVTEFNGPLTFVPGSHRAGVLAATPTAGMPIGYEDAPNWVSTLTAEEKYQIEPSLIADLVQSNGLVSPKGPAGSVLFFHPNILHSSAQNISPFGRSTLIVVYNATSNPATNTTNPRPEFLAARDANPVPIGG
ncbi:phytanoyl-CoA dioxygenase family protein [Micromonospora sp. NPDC049662]|uniref:phytanoyl-CoA dioxygenase family protein n=1 Tax=Micromonospora sp. NPDC049662 TaxID=3155397 RepID=UPI0034461439